jgi:hypothetical protein
MRNPQLVELRRLVARQEMNWRLRPGSRDNLYDLYADGALEVEDATAAEIRSLCMGQIGLASLRQAAR